MFQADMIEKKTRKVDLSDLDYYVLEAMLGFIYTFINNEFVDAVSGKTFPTIDPSDETEIAQIAEADKADVDKAVHAARQAFKIGTYVLCKVIEMKKNNA